MKRVATGIKGFDELIEGGFPQGTANLLLGSYGTGKSIFSLEYIYNGALKKEPGLYVSFEQNEDELINQAHEVGYSKFKKCVKDKLITFLCIPADEIDKMILKKILAAIKKNNVKRVVIDSVSALAINAPIYSIAQQALYKETRISSKIIQSAINPVDLKKDFIYKFIRTLKETGVTSLILSEEENGESTEKITEYVVDGVVILTIESLCSEASRNLIVRKMRRTHNSIGTVPFDITKKGIQITQVE
jgi:KaiC/GvpD/RAD55 family RecA-like ATPase